MRDANRGGRLELASIVNQERIITYQWKNLSPVSTRSQLRLLIEYIPNAGVVGNKSHHKVTLWPDHERIPPHRNRWESGVVVGIV